MTEDEAKALIYALIEAVTRDFENIRQTNDWSRYAVHEASPEAQAAIDALAEALTTGGGE